MSMHPGSTQLAEFSPAGKVLADALACPQIAVLADRLSPRRLPEPGPVSFRLDAGGFVYLGESVLGSIGWCRLVLRLAGELATHAQAAPDAARDSAIAVGSLSLLLDYERMLTPAQRASVRALAPPWLERLLVGTDDMDLTDPARLQRLVDALPAFAAHWPRLDAGIRDPDPEILARLLPWMRPTPVLLTSGADERVEARGHRGSNPYGAYPVPQPDQITFSSCTASTISGPAYASVERFRAMAVAAALAGQSDEFVAGAVEGTRQRLRSALNLPADIIVLFSPSGTDTELLALWLALAQSESRPLLNVVVAPGEVGSGTLDAAYGKHFTTITPLGGQVESGETVSGLQTRRLRVVELDIRGPDGRAMTALELGQSLHGLLAEARVRRERVLLHVVDASKTGMIAPTPSTLESLMDEYGADIIPLIDAAQLRSSNKVLRAYLDAGCLVMITGSKFFTGPPFSGALLVPGARGPTRAALNQLPPGLADYISELDLPPALRPRDLPLQRGANIGQLLRWLAALWEVEAFNATPDDLRRQALELFCERVTRRIADSPWLEAVPTPARPIEVLGAPRDWDAIPSIFTFLVRKPDGSYLNMAEARRAHRFLNSDVSPMLPASAAALERQLASLSCHAGQPVSLATPTQADAGGLRVAAGARYVTGSLRRPDSGAARERRLNMQLRQADQLLAKTELLARYWRCIGPSDEGTA